MFLSLPIFAGHVTVSEAGTVLSLDNGVPGFSGPQVTLTFAEGVAAPADLKTGRSCHLAISSAMWRGCSTLFLPSLLQCCTHLAV
jgi:hypothetical protein